MHESAKQKVQGYRPTREENNMIDLECIHSVSCQRSLGQRPRALSILVAEMSQSTQNVVRELSVQRMSKGYAQV